MVDSFMGFSIVRMETLQKEPAGKNFEDRDIFGGDWWATHRDATETSNPPDRVLREAQKCPAAAGEDAWSPNCTTARHLAHPTLEANGRKGGRPLRSNGNEQ